MERTETIDEIQSGEYAFPYHYLPSRTKFPRFARFWNFSPSYMAALGLFTNWLAGVSKDSSGPHRHIDIGCGDGGFVNAVSMSGKLENVAFTGVDYDERAIFWAKAFARDGGVFECMPLAELPQKDFDSASLIEVVEHIPPAELPKFVAEVASVLKPGGDLFLTVPSTQKPVEQKHYQHFDYAGIQALFAEGWDILECVGFERFTFMSKVVRKLTQGKKHYIETAGLSDYLISTCEKTHKDINGCGRILMVLRKQS